MPGVSAPTHVFEALQAPYRRQLLFALLEANPQFDDDPDPLNLGSDDPASHDVNIDRLNLVHTHLPKLDDWGYIDWEQETGRISKGSNWDEIAPLLRLLHDHQGELPDEWF